MAHKQTTDSLRRTLASLILAVTTSACTNSEPVLQSRCERVRDRIVDLQLADEDLQRDEHAHVLRRALGDQFLATCAGMSPARTECILAATTPKAALDCSNGGSSGEGSAN